MSEHAWLPEDALGSSIRLAAGHAFRAHQQWSHAGQLPHARKPTPNATHRRNPQATLLVVLMALLCACTQRGPDRDREVRVGGSLTSMDYEPTDTFVRPVYVNGRGGDVAGAGGSTVAGAISLPQRWRPGLTVHVKWRRCARGTFHIPGQEQNEGCRWIEKDVPVHPYTYVGTTWLHIFADDQVLVIPGMLAPNHPDYAAAGFPYKNFHKKRGIGGDE